MTTYLEMLEKIQSQALDNVKQIQAVQISTLTAARELLSEIPTAKGLPTLAQITEFSTSFATKLLDQQKEFASELGDVITPAGASKSTVKASAN